MKIEAKECRAALTLIRNTIEEHCPPGVLPSEEMVNGLFGPKLMGEAQAIAAAILTTVAKLQVQATLKPPAPSIRHSLKRDVAIQSYKLYKPVLFYS